MECRKCGSKCAQDPAGGYWCTNDSCQYVWHPNFNKEVRNISATDMSEREKRIEEIRSRLSEYKKHYNNSSSYYQEEIHAVRELESHAPEDIEFLLKEIDKQVR